MGKTTDVDKLLGNPKKAMLAMAIPIIITMMVQSANNLIDTAWVSGLGTKALSAVGFASPLFFMIISIGNGIGIGTSSAISRFIGQNHHESANRTAGQALIITIIVGIISAIVLALIMRPLFTLMGAGPNLQSCIDYFTPLIVMMPVILLGIVFANILRSEGASRKAMYSQVIATIINIILDPFFIYDYGLGMGVTGAAWATGISMSISAILLAYWFFFKKNTYLKIDLNKFKLDRELDKAILRVGFPASIEMIIISISVIFANLLLSYVDADNGVAIYSSTYKFIQVLMIPIIGMSCSVVPVCAAAYGRGKFDNIKICYRFSIFISTIIMAIIIAIVLLTTEYIVTIFTYTDSTAVLKQDMIFGLKVYSLGLILIPWGFVTVGLFQSLGMGLKSLICSIFRNSVIIPTAGFMGIYYHSMNMFWIGIVIGCIIGAVVIGMWGIYVLHSLINENPVDPHNLNSNRT